MNDTSHTIGFALILFAFDWGSRCLLSQSLRIDVRSLAQLGWNFNEADARNGLPRADQSILDTARPALPKGVIMGGPGKSRALGR